MRGMALGIFSVLIGAVGGFLLGWAAGEYRTLKRIERVINEKKKLSR